MTIRNKKFLDQPNLRLMLKKRENPRLDHEEPTPKEDESSPVLRELQELDNLLDESLKARR